MRSIKKTTIQIRVTEEEKEQLRALAKLQGLSVSSYLLQKALYEVINKK